MGYAARRKKSKVEVAPPGRRPLRIAHLDYLTNYSTLGPLLRMLARGSR